MESWHSQSLCVIHTTCYTIPNRCDDVFIWQENCICATCFFSLFLLMFWARFEFDFYSFLFTSVTSPNATTKTMQNNSTNAKYKIVNEFCSASMIRIRMKEKKKKTSKFISLLFGCMSFQLDWLDWILVLVFDVCFLFCGHFNSIKSFAPMLIPYVVNFWGFFAAK